VVASAIKMLDVCGIGAGKPLLGILKAPNFAVRCLIEAKNVAQGSPHLGYKHPLQLCAYRPVFASNLPSDAIHALVRPTRWLLWLQCLRHSRGANNPWTCGTRTLASQIRSTISTLHFFCSRRCPPHALLSYVPVSCELCRHVPALHDGYKRTYY
jgi:hypothetical protein